MSLTFLTPLAALVAFAAVVPVTAFGLAARRVTRVRRVLRLPPPAHTVDAQVLAALVAVVVALALAAAQPALSRTSTQRVRTDAEVLFVIDTSQSMAAAPGPHSATRLDRAAIAAERLRATIPEVPSGVATLTDRILPDLLPVADVGAFDATVRKAVAIEEPPPRALSLRATTFTPLAGVPRSGYFSPSARIRAIVLLTDGESGPFDPAGIGHTLTSSHTPFLAVRFWSASESVFEASGRPDPNYRPDPTGRLALASLASAADGKVFEESDLGAAAAYLRSVLGHGPTRSVGRTRTTHPLAPYVALFGLLPLTLVFRRRFPG